MWCWANSGPSSCIFLYNLSRYCSDFKTPAVIHLFSLCLYLLKRVTCSGNWLSFASISTWFKIPDVVFGSVERSLSIWCNLSQFISFSGYLFRAISQNFVFSTNLGLSDFAFRRLTLTMQGLWSEIILMIMANEKLIWDSWNRQNSWSIKLHDFFTNLVGKVIVGRNNAVLRTIPCQNDNNTLSTWQQQSGTICKIE